MRSQKSGRQSGLVARLVERLAARLRPRRDGEAGAILIIAAIGLVLAVTCAALAVDLGRQAQEARRNQKVADLAALDAVRVLPADPTGAAQQSATRNDFQWSGVGNSLTVEPGTIAADRTFAPGPLAGATAVRVTARSLLKDDFLPGQRTVVRRGVATTSSAAQIGTVRVGSKVATVSSTDKTILNRLLTGTVGGAYNLDAVSWKGIADANVTFSRLRTALGLTAGTADEALNTSITYKKLLQATATALNADGSPSSLAAVTPLTTIATQLGAAGGGNLTLQDLYDISGNAGNGADVADAVINVGDIVKGGAIVADGDHFATMDLTAADITGTIPGLNFARVKFGLIEGPKSDTGVAKDAQGNYPTQATTSQVRVEVELHLQLALTGIPGLTDVNIPYVLDAGSATALLDTITCSGSSSTPTGVDILGRTTAGSSKIGAVNDASLGAQTPPTPTPTTIASVAGLVTVSTNNVVTTTIPGNSGQMLHFSPPYTTSSPSQSISGTTVTLPALATGDLNVSVLGLLNANLIKLDVVNGVGLAMPGVNTFLLSPIYKNLGLSFAGADIWAPPVQLCQALGFTSVPPPPPSATVPVLVI